MPTRRRLIQLYAALLYNANLKGFIEGQIYTGKTKNICVPGLNCYSCPAAAGACPLGALQNALASSRHRAPYYVIGLLLLFGLTLGRLICGFLCPFGLIQELLYKIKTPKIKKSRYTRILSYLKYVILTVFVVIIPLAYAVKSLPLPAFCKYICPAGTMEGAIGLLSNPVNADKFSMLGILFTRKFVIMIFILTVCIFCYRAFCRFLCPLGAIYGFFCRIALLGVRLNPEVCTGCGLCVKKCKMDVRHIGDHECIQCGECMKVCPVHAIEWKGIPRKEKEKSAAEGNEAAKCTAEKNSSGRKAAICWAAALLVLAGALWYCNRPTEDPKNGPVVEESTAAEGEPETSSEEEGAAWETGKEVGMLCPDFTVPMYGGKPFVLGDTRGKITIINFWATWCTPCCSELPYFQKLQDNYADDVEIIAIHSSLVTDDVQAYLNQMGYTIPFGLDETGDVIASLGGSTMLPMTVILDRQGVIVYNQVGSVTYEFLEAKVKEIDQ